MHSKLLAGTKVKINYWSVTVISLSLMSTFRKSAISSSVSSMLEERYFVLVYALAESGI
jgi:hypothetical protein